VCHFNLFGLVEANRQHCIGWNAAYDATGGDHADKLPQ
jgi:hypothetical protein